MQDADFDGLITTLSPSQQIEARRIHAETEEVIQAMEESFNPIARWRWVCRSIRAWVQRWTR
jgi:hypothetical protein